MHIEDISLINHAQLTDTTIFTLSKHCPKLKTLRIPNSILITEASIVELVHKCTQLSHLQISRNTLSEITKQQLVNERNNNKYGKSTNIYIF